MPRRSAQQLSFFDIALVAWKACLKNLGMLVLIALLVGVLPNVIFLAGSEEPLAITLPVLLAGIIAGLCFYALLVLGDIAVIYIIAMSVKGKHVTLRSVVKTMLPRLPAAANAYMRTGLGIMLGLLVLVVPAVVLFIFWVFVGQAVAIKNLPGRQAMRYSWRLVKGRWWKVFGYSLAFFLVSFSASLLVTLPLGINSVLHWINAAWEYAFPIFGIYCTVAMTVLFLELEKSVARER